jgi:hypothetical protein
MLGSSRRRLPKLLSELDQIDLFIHDSLHSERNVRFELDRAWTKLRPGGAIIVDDVDANWVSLVTFTSFAKPSRLVPIIDASTKSDCLGS